MIVISGALVLVALVLLVVGLTMTDLTFVYASIAVSLVAAVFLLIGVFQRRGEQPAGDADGASVPERQATSDRADKGDDTPGQDRPDSRADAGGDAVTAVVPTRSGPDDAAEGTQAQAQGDEVAATAEPPVEDDVDEDDLEMGGNVFVVDGRPRYHVEGCRYLSGRQAEQVDVLDAREEGFTPCGVCKPDLALSEDDEAGHGGRHDEDDEREYELSEDDEEALAAADVPVQDEPEPVRVPTSAQRGSSRAETTAAPAPTARAGGAVRFEPGRGARGGSAEPSPAAVAAAAGTPEAAEPGRHAQSVVLVPDRGRYHRPECRYARGAPGAETVDKAEATQQGYDACGVCKP